MSVTPAPVDAATLAAAARSILACPDDVRLVVDGVPDLREGFGDDDLLLQDHDGVPVITCPEGSALARAARRSRGAVLTLASGLGEPGSASRAAELVLSGRLAPTCRRECDCCTQPWLQIELRPDLALLRRTDPRADGTATPPWRVPLAAFSSPAHELNRGYLQRCVSHATACHGDDLRAAVARRTARPVTSILDATLLRLEPHAAHLRWIDVDGAHDCVLPFGRAARDAADLGLLLREALGTVAG